MIASRLGLPKALGTDPVPCPGQVDCRAQGRVMALAQPQTATRDGREACVVVAEDRRAGASWLLCELSNVPEKGDLLLSLGTRPQGCRLRLKTALLSPHGHAGAALLGWRSRLL